MEDTLRFLDRVWGTRPSWVDLPSKVNGHWIPFNAEWPDDRDLLARRIDSCLEDDEDVYFSVAQFASRGRRLADTLPSPWLWADLDRVDPVFLDEDMLQPTIAWESSDGRWQSLWRLDRPLPPPILAKLNRLLSYALGADKTGWDLTQVLRPPGTRNYKYDPPAEVELLWDSTKIYTPQSVLAAVRRLEPELSRVGPLTHSAEAARAGTRERKAGSVPLPARARALLRTPPEMVVVGERSGRLWELERLLSDAGLNEDEIFELVWGCAWNKHREVDTGERRLRTEIRKAIASEPRSATPRGSRNGSPSVDLERSRPDTSDRGAADEVVGERRRRATSPFVDYATFLSANLEAPRWLVSGIWSASSHGIIGGEPKTSKTTMALALGLSVASGAPFMGVEALDVPGGGGPVLMVQEETAPWKVQDSLRKLAKLYGLISDRDVEITPASRGSLGSHVIRLDFPKEAPLKLLNNYGFDLTDDEDREMLEEAVRVEGARLVILDPLYMMAPGVNLDKTHDVMPILQWLLALRYNHNCGVVLIHHSHKANENSSRRRAGQRLLGATAFHGWIESALYFERLDDEGDRINVRMEREYRNVAPQPALEWSVRLGEPGELDMDVRMSRYDVAGLINALVNEQPGLWLTDVATEMGVDKKTARSRVVGAGCVMQRVKRGRGHAYRVYPPGTELDDAAVA